MTRSDDEIDRIALKHKLETDFYFFVRYAFHKTTGRKWSRNWHHETLCRKMEAVNRGDIKRLVINLPPRYSKTEIIVVMFIAWSLAKAADCEFINVSYAARLAANNGAKARDIVSAGWFQEIWPSCRIRSDANSKDDWRTVDGGVVYSTGSGGTITGFGAGKDRPGFGGAIIIDDPHKADEADSETIREGVIDWFGNTLESRANTADTPIILIMQRLEPRDLAGFLLIGGNGEKWEHVCLKAIQDDGLPLWPEKHSIERLEQMKAANVRVFNAQYQQSPSKMLLTAPLWTAASCLRARGAVRTEDCSRIVVSVDAAGGRDKIGIVAAGNMADDKFGVLEDATMSSESPKAWAEKVVELYRSYGADAVVVEINFGGNMIRGLIHNVDPNVSVIEVRASRGKHIRAEPVAALYEQERVTHNGALVKLEAQMQEMAVGGWTGEGSPDHLDALVWALTELSGIAPQPELDMDALRPRYRGL